MHRYILVLIIYPLSLLSLEIEFKKITNRQIFVEKDNKKQSYQLTAKKYIENFSKKDRVKFFINRKLYMLKHNYYSKGVFESKKTKLSYKKAYVLFGKVHLFDVNGTIDKAKVTAKEVIYDGYQSYLLKICKIIKDNHIYRRNEFKLSTL